VNPKERLLAVLNREKVDRPPVAIPTQCATVDVMKRADVYWPQALQHAEPMAKLALACQKECGFESVRLPFDINVEAETMGCDTRYGEEADPPMCTPKERRDLGELKFSDPKVSGRMAQTIQAVSIAAGEKNPDIPLIAALGTPFEILSTIYNFDDLYEDLKTGQDRLTDLLENIVQMQIAYGQLLISAGADVMMVVDGTSQTLMPDQFRQFSMPYTKSLIGSFSIPSILHICGNPTRLIADMVNTGAKGLSLDWAVQLEKAREFSGGKTALIGNLNVARLHSGEPDEVIEMTKNAAKSGWDVIAPGCGIIPSTPIQNLFAFVDTVKAL